MAAGNLDDPLSDIPNVVLVDQSAATAAPGAGFVRVEAVNGVLGIRVGTGDWTPLAALIAGLLSSLTEKESPASGDWLLLQDTADSDELKKVDVDNLPGGTGGGLYDAYVCVTDQKSQNTNGDALASGGWRTRTVNTEQSDAEGICSLGSNQITLSAGTYDADITVPHYYTQATQARLQNTTAATTLLTSQSGYYDAHAGSQGDSFPLRLAGRITVAAAQALEIQSQVALTNNGTGGGQPANFGPEVYTIAVFRRVAA